MSEPGANVVRIGWRLILWLGPLAAGYLFVQQTGTSFRDPWYLLLLLLLPLAAWLRGRRGEPAALIYSSIALVQRLATPNPARAGSVLSALRWLALAFFIIALARPQNELGESRREPSGIDIVLSVDLSDSMLADDLDPNRLEVAKQVLQEFIANRPNDRIGLVVFSGKAYIASPLTLDHPFLSANIKRLTVDTFYQSDEEGTAIGSGVMAAINRLVDLKKSKSKIVVLMTDGQNNAGKIPPLQAAEVAHTLGIKVYTIGVGKKGTSRLPRPNPFVPGGFVYVPLNVEIDEETLQKIAARTGGKFYRAENADTLRSVYAEINQLETTERDPKRFRIYRDFFAEVILTGLLVLLLELALTHTLLRRIP